MKLTKNFQLEEFLRSGTAILRNYSEQFRPPDNIVSNLQILATELQKVRDLVGEPMPVTSGWRCNRLNKQVGGSSTSAHLEGLAADVNMGSKEKNEALFEFVSKLVKSGKLKIDQLINEYDYSWIHFGYRDKEANYRNQIFNVK
ncbi:MAG: peptidase M15 [Tannerella sp.]|jgi:uncharacterized protein YcbK (DUF882 family)|nr:peptidase M15 [Tannerella sp.]